MMVNLELEGVCEESESSKSIIDVPLLTENSVKRLSCFEEICSSEQADCDSQLS